MARENGGNISEEEQRQMTEDLLERLREHHPDAEQRQGWRSMDLPPPKVERPPPKVERPEPEKVLALPKVERPEPEKVLAPSWADAISTTPRTATMTILMEVAAKHGVTVSDIKAGRRRYRRHVVARHEAMTRLRLERAMTMPEIGRLLGGYDHSTIIHGLRQHAARVQREAEHGPQ